MKICLEQCRCRGFCVSAGLDSLIKGLSTSLALPGGTKPLLWAVELPRPFDLCLKIFVWWWFQLTAAGKLKQTGPWEWLISRRWLWLLRDPPAPLQAERAGSSQDDLAGMTSISWLDSSHGWGFELPATWWQCGPGAPYVPEPWRGGCFCP